MDSAKFGGVRIALDKEKAALSDFIQNLKLWVVEPTPSPLTAR